MRFTLITSQQYGNQGIIMIIPKLILLNEKYSHNPKLLRKGFVYFELCVQLIGATEHTALWRWRKGAGIADEQMFPLLQPRPNPQVILIKRKNDL